MLEAGDFFTGLYPAGSGKQRRFIVLTNESSGLSCVAWVFLSTQMNDKTVVLPKNSHPLITQDCCIVYDQATIVETKRIEEAVVANALQKHLPLSAQLLRIVQEGLFESPDTSDAVVEFCTDLI